MDKQCLVKKPLVNICKKNKNKHKCCSSDELSDDNIIGPTGPTGPTGPVGPTGPAGPTGPVGSALSFANFYALMPSDNPDQLFSGDSIAFPKNNIISGTDITRFGVNFTEFNLASIGKYQVYFVFTISQTGQVGVYLNGTLLINTVVGMPTRGQLSGTFIIDITNINTVLSIRLPGNRDPDDPATADVSFILTNYAGMANKSISPVSAQLIITRLS